MSPPLLLVLMAIAQQTPAPTSDPMMELEPDAVVWRAIAPRPPTRTESVVLLRSAQGKRTLSLRHAPEPQAPAAASMAPLPLFADLLADAQPRAFGSDSRCVVETAEAGTSWLRCRPGKSISGATWVLGRPFPAGGQLHVQLASRGDANFLAEITGAGSDARDPRALRIGTDRLRLPELSHDGRAQLAIFASAEGGALALDRLEIAPATSVMPRSDLVAWAWSAELWTTAPAALVAAARARGITRLFVSLNIARGVVRDTAMLGRFIRLARASGILVDAVEGDPAMVGGEGLQRAIVRAQAFAAYQRRARREDRLAGIQYDVEPYILPGWGGGAASYAGWAEAIVQLAAAAGEPVDLVLPFWITGSGDGLAFLGRVSPAVRMITVMSYRTQAAVLAQIALPMLAWGSRHAKPVRLSLEAGPVPDEVEEEFRPAASGTVAVLAGAEPAVLLLAAPQAIAGARMYRFHRRTTIRGAAQSFLGNEGAMRALASQTAPVFSAWPAFSGFALHGLSWPTGAAVPATSP